MKNNAKEHNPKIQLSNRLLATTKFVDLKDIKNKTILNIGCGFGWFELWALNNGAKKVVGLDTNSEDIQLAQKVIKSKKVSFVVGDALELPFKNGSFDSVYAWEVVEHIPKNTESMFFAEIGRVTKKSGKLYLSTPSNYIATTLLDPAWWFIGHRHYSVEMLRAFFTPNFVEQQHQVVGRAWSIVGLLNMYVSKWLLKRGPILYNRYERKITDEYQQSGYFNLFLKLKRVTQ